jgi:phenylacetate-CoA ligase
MAAISQRFDEFVHGRVLFPFSSFLFNRRGILRNYRELTRSEFYPEEVLRETQFIRLKALLEYASNYIPFYRERFKQIGFDWRDLKEIEDLRQIPPLSRQEVIDFHREMVDHRCNASIGPADGAARYPGTPIPFALFRKHKLVRNTSSGSTGLPTVFYEDGSRTALNWAHELRLKNWYGVPPGAREVRMVRISTDYTPKSGLVRFRKRVWNQLLLPGVNMAEKDYAFCLEAVRKFRPRVLWGFTSAVAGFAGFLKQTGIDISPFRPQLVVGWAAPLYEHEEKLMREVFGCHVTSIYGAREVGHIAGRCPHGSFHVNQENLLVEHHDENGNAKWGNLGEILVTTLDISPMPFIRYRMGDVGEVVAQGCACGRKLKVISNLLGRTGEIFIAKDKRMISPNFWCRTFMSSKISGAVNRFQIIYTKDKDLRIKIERASEYCEETEQYIRDMVARNFSEDTGLEIVYVPKIEQLISGKYQMVVNEA